MSHMEVDICGTRKWYDKQNRLHRIAGPAVEYLNGSKYWYNHGVLHRDDGPAIEQENGIERWYQYGKQHRDDGPASKHADGSKLWYRHGHLHRVDGPAIERADGTVIWSIYDAWFNIVNLNSLVRRIQRLFRRAVKKRHVMKQRWLDELLVHPPRGLFPGGVEYQASVTHFESSKLLRSKF